MFEKTLTDIVRGIRKTKRDKPKFIQQCIDEIKAEIASADMFVKANALQKMTFFQMMGYSMNWASFATIEVMSSARFSQKRIGYLAACQGFRQDTEVILLTTNLLKKELQGASTGGLQGVYNAGVALNCLSNIVTEDLAKDLLPEVTNLTTHHQPYLRKKSVLVLFKMFVRYPEGLRLTFSKLQKCMEDPNSAVVSCAVNVITELSDKNPKNYLSLAPAFFQLLSRSSNNWMLIKVVKLLGSLVPEEPRLARKLLEPLAEIVRNTQAKSLLYESVYTITLCLPYTRKSDGSIPSNVPAIVDLCAETLHDLIQQTDQNLKYLGLVGFGSLMQSCSSVLSDPKYRPLVLSCLSDEDVTIRTRALELCPGISSRKNLRELVEQLLNHVEAATGDYKLDLVAKVIQMCSGDKYAMLQDFRWYVDVLFRLGHVRGIDRHGELLRAQITDVAIRVVPVRPFVVQRSIGFLLEVSMENSRESRIVHQILPAIAWVIGEYSDCIREAAAMNEEASEYDLTGSDGIYDCLVQNLMALDDRPASTDKIFLHAAMKVTAAASGDRQTSENEVQSCLVTLEKFLPIYAHSLSSEVAEQAVIALSLLKALGLTKNAMASTSLTMQTGDFIGMINPREEEKEEPLPVHQGSAGARMKQVSQTLVYILKPSPMKPCGAKAQRKRHQSFIESIPKVDVDQVFGELFANETQEAEDRSLTTESVCFTQQTPLVTVSEPVENATAKSSSPWAPSPPAPRPRNRKDPFYLEEDPSTEQTALKEGPNRFGAIQLFDSDDDEDNHREVSKKKKKKKHKRRAKASIDPFLGADDELFRVDDDDSDSGNVLSGRDQPKRRPGREFAGLARVDLTKPPKNKAEIDLEAPVPPKMSSSSKKPKKSKKPKSKRASSKNQPAIGDLLDLGEVSSPPPSLLANVGPMQSKGSNAIDSAFDIFAPSMTPTQQLDTTSIPMQLSAPEFWLRASTKSSTTQNTATSLDVCYKVVQDTFGSPSSFVLHVKIRNLSSHSQAAILNVGDSVLDFGPLAPSGSCMKTANLHLPTVPKDLKGLLKNGGDSFPVKLRLPCMLLPDSLTVDELASELAAQGWTGVSATVAAHGKNSAAMEALRLFLHGATPVLGGQSSESAVSWAAKSSGGPIRFLVKAFDGSIQVDVRAQNAQICKAIVSDLKRLELV